MEKIIENGVVYNSSKTKILGHTKDIPSVLTIPDSVESIGDDAFYRCARLKSVTIGKSVKIIGSWAFGFCESLTSIKIPDSVTSLGNYAFNGCSKLKSVTIPNSVTTIGQEAFCGCVNFSDNSVSYVGTTSQWSSVSIGVLAFPSGTTIQCVDGSLTIA